MSQIFDLSKEAARCRVIEAARLRSHHESGKLSAYLAGCEGINYFLRPGRAYSKKVQKVQPPLRLQQVSEHLVITSPEGAIHMTLNSREWVAVLPKGHSHYRWLRRRMPAITVAKAVDCKSPEAVEYYLAHRCFYARKQQTFKHWYNFWWIFRDAGPQEHHERIMAKSEGFKVIDELVAATRTPDIDWLS